MRPHMSPSRGTVALLAFLAAAGITGCGGIAQISITSEPSGATVTVDGLKRGTTPLTAKVGWEFFKATEITLEHPDCLTLKTRLLRSRTRTGREYGKTTRVGDLSVPVNVAVVSGESGLRYSLTLGGNLATF